MNFTEKQISLILQASAVSNRVTDAFFELSDATSRADKLRLLEPYHRLTLEEIELLRQAGDPDAEQKLAREECNYKGLLAQYQAMTDEKPAPSPGAVFDEARRKIILAHKGREAMNTNNEGK